jgi:hypothetical protein
LPQTPRWGYGAGLVNRYLETVADVTSAREADRDRRKDK